ncbi:unnamed protein product [Paramecium pentaurelia]|uniref:EH domain-containing protein n=1 Tax=Paramecium pentaurelia TaxID=43138 RepID=A0A8S1WT96_9CILI|nr:unnamed protein product [Paramecium pentaurelia]
MFQYTPQEETYYRQLWAPFDPQGLGFAEAKGTVQFFKKSRLPVDTLKRIWIAGVKSQEGKLYYSEFATVMRLIAYCQNGFEFNEQLLNQNSPVPLPVMEGIQIPQQQQQPQQQLIQQSQQQQFNNFQQAQNQLPQSNYFQTQPVPNNVQISLQSYLEPKLEFSKYDLPDDQYNKYELCFTQQDKAHQGSIQGDQALAFFQKSQLPASTLNQLWSLVDIGQKGFLFKNEFIVAVHLIALCRKDTPLPQVLPESLLQLIRRDQQQNQVRSTSQTMPQIISGLPPQPQRAGSQNELQGSNLQTSYQQNKIQNQTQQIQFANNVDQQKQIIEDKKKDVEFLNQTIQKLQSFYDFLKKEQDELQAQITSLNDQQTQKQHQMNILQDSILHQLQVNQNLQKQLYELKQTNQVQENQTPTQTTQFQTIHIEDDYDYSNYRAKKDKVVSGGNQNTENFPWH